MEIKIIATKELTLALKRHDLIAEEMRLRLEEPDLIRELRATGFKFGKLDDLGTWKPKDRNVI